MNIFQEFIKNKTPTYKENLLWRLENDVIEIKDPEFADCHAESEYQPFDIHQFDRIFKPIALYFREWQKMANLEAQVLIVSNDDYNKHYNKFPTLNVKDNNIRVVVLPQYNTPANTIVADDYWHKTVKGDPIMRIHSHHILNAYQSKTDFESLNSGTLEVVFGRVDTDTIEVAYWLSRHSDITAKERVFYTTLELTK